MGGVSPFCFTASVIPISPVWRYSRPSDREGRIRLHRSGFPGEADNVRPLRSRPLPRRLETALRCSSRTLLGLFFPSRRSLQPFGRRPGQGPHNPQGSICRAIHPPRRENSRVASPTKSYFSTNSFPCLTHCWRCFWSDRRTVLKVDPPTQGRILKKPWYSRLRRSNLSIDASLTEGRLPRRSRAAQ